MTDEHARHFWKFGRTWLRTAVKVAAAITVFTFAVVGLGALFFLPVLIDGYLSFGYMPLKALDVSVSQYSVYTHVAEFVWVIVVASAIYAGYKTWGESHDG